MADSSKILKRPKNVINQCRVNTFWKYMEKNSGHYIQAGVVTLLSVIIPVVFSLK
jgi:hypothetical protein